MISSRRTIQCALISASCYLPSLVAHAQPLPDVAQEVTAVIDEVLEQYRVILNCSATLPTSGPVMQDYLDRGLQDAAEVLHDMGFGAVFVAEFRRRADFGTLLMADSPFSDVIAFCNEFPDLELWIVRLDYRNLSDELLEIANSGPS